MRWAPIHLLPCALAVLAAASSAGPAPADGAAPARRIVSMNPSLTSILVALEAGERIVGAEQHSLRLHPELAGAAPVGGLFNPSLEAVIALDPDLVVLVPSAEQRDFRSRLEALGIEVLVLPNISVAEILASIEVLGDRVGRPAAAAALVARIRSAFARTRREAAERAPTRAVVVLQRDPLYVVGSGSFIDEMLGEAGVVNLGREFDEPYPRTGIEWLIAAAPELILDASDDPVAASVFWGRWPSIPAVASGRVLALPQSATFPGPDIDRSLRWIVERVRAPAAAGGGATRAMERD